jgi:Asp-tRNA(Asn)/Glu-tRNA(Gln) amidotransferase A subunit family amidase
MASASASSCPDWIESKEWEILCRESVEPSKLTGGDAELWENAVNTLKEHKVELDEDEFLKLNEEARETLDLADVSGYVPTQTQEVSFNDYTVSRWRHYGDKKWKYELYKDTTTSLMGPATRQKCAFKAAKFLDGDHLMIYDADGDDEWGYVFFSGEWN